MTAVPVDSFEFRVCREHRALQLRSDARVTVQQHQSAFRARRLLCEKCARGQRYHYWRCKVIGGPHWHTGHATGEV